jgi:hypothetical protein
LGLKRKLCVFSVSTSHRLVSRVRHVAASLDSDAQLPIVNSSLMALTSLLSALHIVIFFGAGKQAWNAFNASGDFVKSAVPLLPKLLGDGGATSTTRILLYTGMFDEVRVKFSINFLF